MRAAPAQALVSPAVHDACRALQRGRFITVFDAEDREGETDLFVPAQAATPASIRRLRQEAGGLVFVAIGPQLHDALGLPFLQDALREAAARWPILDELLPGTLPYDAKSSFSLTVNHRDTFTGITDHDRSLTVRALGRLASLEPCLPREELRARFTKGFRAPGHVHLCSAARGLLAERRGHTELAIALARLSGIPEAVVGAEMLDGDHAMVPEAARRWAGENGIPFVEGADLLSAWETLQEAAPHIPSSA